MDRSVTESFSDKISIFFNNIIEKLKISQDMILHYGIAIGVGFLIGFLLKKFSSYVALIIAGCLAIIILSHFDIINITIDFQKMQSIVGFESIDFSNQNIFEIMWQFIKSNVSMTLCMLIGFFIGLKLG